MSVSDSIPIRQASALLAVHLQQRQRDGCKRVWLRPGTRLALERHGVPATGSGATAPPNRAAAPAGRVAPGEAKRLLAEIEAEARVSSAPLALGTLRDTFVFADGDPAADLVFVGEAPGAEEEKLGRPFVGPAGELLDKIIKAMGLARDQVYITNIVKYRPRIEGDAQGRANRKPSPEELAASLPVLRKQLEVIRPKVIVALGGTALAGLTGNPEARIGQARGRFSEYLGIPMMPTFHPSYLLRQEDEAAEKREKRKLWEDMLLVMERLSLPISAKQRGFFATK